jgi:hypothetical protein
MRTLPFCAKIGWIHGLLAGALFGFLRQHTAPLTPGDLAWSTLAFTLLVTAVSLFILVAVARYNFHSLAWQTVVNAAIVTTLTGFLVNTMPAGPFMPLIALAIGVVIGILTGLLLCRLCGDPVSAVDPGGLG